MVDKEEDDESPKEPKWLYLIPEIYFDLISRVPPGILAILIFMWMNGYLCSARLKTVLDLTATSAALLSIFLISAGYVLGVLMTPAGIHITYRLSASLYKSLYSQTKNEWTSGIRNLVGDDPANNASSKWKKFRLRDDKLHNYLKTKDAKTSSLMTKMRAEATLCDHVALVLQSALIASLAVLLSRSLTSANPVVCVDPRLTYGNVLTLLIMAILALYASRHRHLQVFQRGLDYVRFLNAEARVIDSEDHE